MKKNLRFVSTIMILLLVTLACAIILTACGHEHEVLKWKTVKEPTCTTEGVRRGACYECGEVVEEAIATVAENHVYGSWQITVVPSYNRNGIGEATRVCTENAEHTQKVTLPRLTKNGTGYKEFEIFEEATVVSEGRLAATYESEYGDIAFNINVPKKDFDPESVEDAVLLGSSNKDLIRSGSGEIDIGYNTDGKSNPTQFSYEFGTDYIHTYYAGDKMDIWVSLTSKGKPFGVLRRVSIDGSEEIMEYPSASKADLDGYHYKIMRADRDFYGAEGLLLNAYIWGKRDDNDDFKEGITTENGEKLYWFSFGYYSVPQYFCKIVCKFTLTEDGAVRYIRMDTDSYARVPGTDDTNPDNQFGLSFNPNTNKTIAYLLPGCGNPIYNEFIEYHQVTKAESPEEPVHEYTEAAFRVAEFTVTHNGKTISEEASDSTPTFKTGGGSNSLVVELRKVLPETANFSYDPFTVYRINANGRRIMLDETSTTDAVWVYSSKGSNKITIRSRLAGYIKLAIVTESGCERIFTVYAEYSAPSTLYPSVYEYSDAGYAWKTSTTKNTTATVCVGQSLTMKAGVASSYLAYVDPSYNATIVSGGESATVTPIADTENVRFVATAPGEYVVEMRSTLNTNIVAKVTVTVVDAPSIDTLLTGEYVAALKKGDATVKFGTMGADGKVLATVTTNKGTEILTVYYDEQYKTIVSEHADGATFGVRIEMNEAYKLVLANPTGFGGGKERAVMYVATEEELL